MAQFFAIHPDNPQDRLIKQAADIVRSGGVIVYPTDSCYALGCKLGDKNAMERILAIRKIDQKHHLTLMCADLSELGTYAKVDNAQFRQLKAATPLSCRQPKKCPIARFTPNVKPSACVFPTTLLPWHFCKNWANLF